MSVIDYCCWVQDAVLRALTLGDLEAFADSGRASRAVLWALFAEDDRALAIAEPLADRYWKYLHGR